MHRFLQAMGFVGPVDLQPARFQIFPNREAAEHLPALGAQGRAPSCHSGGRGTGDVPAIQGDPAPGGEG